MKSAWLLLLAVYVLAMSSALLSQALDPAARDILNADRPLQPAETTVVLAATRDALSGKTLRLSYVPNGPGPEVLMGTNGRPRFLRAVSGYDYQSGGVGADGNGNRTQSQQSGHVDVDHLHRVPPDGPHASVTAPLSTPSSSSNTSTRAPTTAGP